MYGYDPSKTLNREQQEICCQVKERLRAKAIFNWHLVSYIIGNGLLLMIYLFTCLPVGGFYYPWFIWPFLGWSVGLALHFAKVYLGQFSLSERHRLVEAELRKMDFNS